jgi:MFS transporter, ACS family, allantoate permease
VGQLLRHSTTDTVSSNHVPWLIVGICSVAGMVLLYSIRLLLAHENKRRDAEPPEYSYDDVYIMKIDDEGKSVKVKVSKVRVCFR